MVIHRIPALIALTALLSAVACGDGPTGIDDEVPLADRVLVFSQDGDIWRMNGDGTGRINLTNSPAVDDNPAWSPDGLSIYFNSLRSGDVDLFRMDADGTDVAQLTSAELGAYPAPAPDGQRVAFVTAVQDLDLAIREANGTIRTLSALPGNESSPAWSRLGDRIAFSRDGTERGLYTVRPDGTPSLRLTTWQSDWPSWSPDGTRMVVLGGPVPGARLWVVRADGSNPEPLTPSEYFAGAADWSSDGRWIVFPSAQPAPAGFWVVRPDGSDLQRLSYTGTGQFPRWRPLPVPLD